MAAEADSTRAVFYALGANFAIAVTKYVAAAMTGSSSMLAEAVHSTADCANQLLLLLGLKRSKRPPTLDFPLGFGKEIYFWSFVVAIMLEAKEGEADAVTEADAATEEAPLLRFLLGVDDALHATNSAVPASVPASTEASMPKLLDAVAEVFRTWRVGPISNPSHGRSPGAVKSW